MAQRESQSDTTIDHDEIRRWAEERDGAPATVKGTGKKNDAGILRLDFEPKDQELEEISWDEFFDKFEQEGLAFLYQEQTAEGKVSRFHKFVQREAGQKASSRSKSSGAAKPAASSKRGSGAAQKTGAKQAATASKSSRQAQSEPKKRASSKKS
jgi:hypothetical protein